MEGKTMVTLVKKADFTFDENSYKSVDKSLFDMLVDVKTPEDNEGAVAKPEVIVFKDKAEYANSAWMYNIDETKPVYVNDKNQIFCFCG